MPLYPFPEMQLGESFTFPIDPANVAARGKSRDLMRVRQAAAQYKRRNAGWNYTVRKLSATQGECRRLA
jgi:hypothetical protein